MINKIFFGMIIGLCVSGSGFTYAQENNTDCVRAIPEPIFPHHENVKNYSFTKKSAQEAIENLTLPSGLFVHIENGGCEDFSWIIEFKLSNENHNLKDTKFWLAKASQVVDQLRAIEKQSNFNSIQNAFKKALSQKNYDFEQTIETIEGYEYTTLSVQAINATESKVKISFAIAL